MSRIPPGRPIRNTGMKSVDSVIRRQSGLRNSNGESSSGTQQKATNIENQFRYALLRKNLNFIEQASIGPWSIDFYLPEHDIIIEADGEFWHNSIKSTMLDLQFKKDSIRENVVILPISRVVPGYVRPTRIQSTKS